MEMIRYPPIIWPCKGVMHEVYRIRNCPAVGPCIAQDTGPAQRSKGL